MAQHRLAYLGAGERPERERGDDGELCWTQPYCAQWLVQHRQVQGGDHDGRGEDDAPRPDTGFEGRATRP